MFLYLLVSLVGDILVMNAFRQEFQRVFFKQTRQRSFVQIEVIHIHCSPIAFNAYNSDLLSIM